MRKIIWILIAIILVIGLGTGALFYSWIWGSNVPESYGENIITVPSGSSFNDVLAQLNQESALKNDQSFKWVSKLMNYNRDSVPSGKFRISKGWSNRQLITNLRAGNQTPVELTFNQLRTLDELAGQISKYLEPDSLTILEAFSDTSVIHPLGYTKETIISLFIPNTYEIYWDTDPVQLLSRMKNEHTKFWSQNDRLAKAEKLGLDTKEVYTLASIVEKESLVKNEKPRIAGVYLNRLERGMLLQADPTVVFGVGDFTIQRVLNKHLAHDSPYNTYIYAGLPPGPICMPTISSIDGVLDVEDHNYIFFCAKPESGGRHAFASNLAGHNRNARVYRSWLQENRIR